jgi:hypothetical protein
MTQFDAVQDIDGQGKVLRSDFAFRTRKTITFAGGTTDAWGDDGGALDGGAIFTVTGLVKVQLFGEVTTNLAGGATAEVGITGATAIFCAQETDTNLDAGNIWLNNATPAAYYIIGEEQAAADNAPIYTLNGQDIILTTAGGANTTSGVIDFFALWSPISDDAAIEDSGN